MMMSQSLYRTLKRAIPGDNRRDGARTVPIRCYRTYAGS